MDYKIYDIHEKIDILENYVEKLNRPVVYVHKIGIANSTDQEKIDNAHSFYESILPSEVYQVFLKHTEFTILFHSNDLAEDFARDHFPAKNTNDETYVYAMVFNGLGQLIYDNK